MNQGPSIKRHTALVVRTAGGNTAGCLFNLYKTSQSENESSVSSFEFIPTQANTVYCERIYRLAGEGDIFPLPETRLLIKFQEAFAGKFSAIASYRLESFLPCAKYFWDAEKTKHFFLGTINLRTSTVDNTNTEWGQLVRVPRKLRNNTEVDEATKGIEKVKLNKDKKQKVKNTVSTSRSEISTLMPGVVDVQPTPEEHERVNTHDEEKTSIEAAEKKRLRDKVTAERIAEDRKIQDSRNYERLISFLYRSSLDEYGVVLTDDYSISNESETRLEVKGIPSFPEEDGEVISYKADTDTMVDYIAVYTEDEDGTKWKIYTGGLPVQPTQTLSWDDSTMAVIRPSASG